ncbi:unnamed protein product [Symbiodinium microadriaticum]|nr:unnamed protein product [Symbiodinium microadriaticum]
MLDLITLVSAVGLQKELTNTKHSEPIIREDNTDFVASAAESLSVAFDRFEGVLAQVLETWNLDCPCVPERLDFIASGTIALAWPRDPSAIQRKEDDDSSVEQSVTVRLPVTRVGGEEEECYAPQIFPLLATEEFLKKEKGKGKGYGKGHGKSQKGGKDGKGKSKALTVEARGGRAANTEPMQSGSPAAQSCAGKIDPCVARADAELSLGLTSLVRKHWPQVVVVWSTTRAIQCRFLGAAMESAGAGDVDFRAVLIPVISRADAHELAKVQTACRMWREADVLVQGRWMQLLLRDFLQDWGGASRYRALAQPQCQRCNRLFWAQRRGAFRRCPCVAWRDARPSLTIVSLNLERCADGSFCEWSGFSAARAATTALFQVQFRSVPELSDAALETADLVFLHTTSAKRALSAAEQATLSRFCSRGGTAVLNCFSAWTVNGGWGKELVKFLGIFPEPSAKFGAGYATKLSTAKGLEDLCLAGPWGAPHAYQSWSSILRAMRSEAVLSNDEARCFINLGETNFNAWLPLESGDAIPVCTSGLQESPLSRKTPLWFPKVNGAGQAFLCSNLHWLADKADDAFVPTSLVQDRRLRLLDHASARQERRKELEMKHGHSRRSGQGSDRKFFATCHVPSKVSMPPLPSKMRDTLKLHGRALHTAAAVELSPAGWCARGFDIADAIGGKCCRQELLQMGLLSPEWRPDLPFLGPTSPILVDMVRVNGPRDDPPIFYHRFFHDHAEVVPQALWEYFHYISQSSSFAAALAARRSGGAPCEQREAALEVAMADTTALPWLAQRWVLTGNSRLDTFVNIGARDGVHEDPLHPLLSNPADVRFALAVEMDLEFCEQHARNLPHVELLCMRATKATVPDIVARLPEWLRGQKRPAADLSSLPRLDVLKVDLDGADCDLAALFLWKVLAKFVVMEVCDAVPPPLRFNLHDDERLVWPPKAPWGCSLSYQVQLMKQFDLQLVWYGAGNAIFAHRLAAHLLGLPSPLDEVDCYAKSVLMTMWPSGRTLRRWFYEDNLNDTFIEVRAALTKRLGNLPFTLEM